MKEKTTKKLNKTKQMSNSRVTLATVNETGEVAKCFPLGLLHLYKVHRWRVDAKKLSVLSVTMATSSERRRCGFFSVSLSVCVYSTSMCHHTHLGKIMLIS